MCRDSDLSYRERATCMPLVMRCDRRKERIKFGAHEAIEYMDLYGFRSDCEFVDEQLRGLLSHSLLVR